MRKSAILLSALLVTMLVAGAAGPAVATHDNPNWGDDAGNQDCSAGHINPHDDGEVHDQRDDCGADRGAPSAPGGQ